jgi:hypothetical protein
MPRTVPKTVANAAVARSVNEQNDRKSLRKTSSFYYGGARYLAVRVGGVAWGHGCLLASD